MKLCNGMIIQRDVEYPVWTDEKASVLFLGKKYESRECGERWLILLDPVNAGGPYTLEISTACETRVFKDIYSGDLWLCSGQSNMEMQMSRLCDDYPEEWKLSEYPVIRQFNVPQELDFDSPRKELSGGDWIKASNETLNEFTATGWFFARNLYKKLREKEKEDVPIGIIYAAWGGTPIESWMSRDALASYPAIISEGEQYSNKDKVCEIIQRTAYSILEWENNINNEDVGFALGWHKPESDISGWADMVVPGDFSSSCVKHDEELKNFCGSVWLAKDFEIKSDFAESKAKVWLGTIIDADTVYINGKEIGNTGYRYPPRKYACNGLLKEGINRIVIRVTCNNGQGGITPGNYLRIFTDNENIELSGIWKYKIGASAPERPEEFFIHYKPMGCYNAMIAPILNYPVKGVIWYQGESNESRPGEYADLFKKMILDWRDKYKYADKKNCNTLPFFFVQLPVYLEQGENNENANWALLREAQASALSLPFTGMAAAWEFGEWNDIHPVNKKDVGYRLFLAAEKSLFNAENTSPGAMMQRWERKGEKLFIYFNNCGKGLKCLGGQREPKGQVSVITDEKQINASAGIEAPDCLSIDLTNIKNPRKILYAWANNPKHRSFYNSEGLPVLPFRITI